MSETQMSSGLKTVDKLSSIEEALGYLEESIEELNQEVGNMIMRISSVLTPEDAADTGNGPGIDPRVMQSPITERLTEMTSRLHKIRKRLLYTNDRIEL